MRAKAPFLRQPCSRSRDFGSISTLVTPLVASLDKALYDNYRCLVALKSNKLTWKYSKNQTENLKFGNLSE